MRRQEGTGDGTFQLHGLRIWESTVGIDDVANTALSVHPNPARQTVTVTLPDHVGILTLLDATGRQLMQRPTATSKVALDVSKIPLGLYLLQFTSSHGTTTTRFVVQ